MKRFRALLGVFLALSLGFAPAVAQVARPSPGFRAGFKTLGAPSVAGSTWNPSGAGVGVAFALGNTKATGTTGDWAGALGTQSRSSGKRGFAVQVGGTTTFTTNLYLGLGQAGINLDNAAPYSDAFLWAWQNQGGDVFHNGSDIGDAGQYPSGSLQVNLVLADLTAGKLWFYNAGTGLYNNDILANQNPATGAGGISIPAGTYFPLIFMFNNGDPLESYGILNTTTASSLPGWPAGWSDWG